MKKHFHVRFVQMLTGIILAFFAYWALAWLCVEWPVTDVLVRPLLGIVRFLSVEVFCSMSMIGGVGFLVYNTVILLRNRLRVTRKLKALMIASAIISIPVLVAVALIAAE